MIPADAPPSFDGHRESTFATVPFGGAVLQRADPGQSGQPGLDDRFRLRSVHRDAEPTDGGKTYTFKIRDGVKFHDGSPLTAADVAASWNKIVFPAGRRAQRRGRAIS
jgi:peptide/nickel transport system substrate-binding protein